MSEPDSAEAALLGLAHDLIEEIAAGRALELAAAPPAPAPLPVSPVPKGGMPPEIPKPKKGAAAVHPHLGSRLVTLPGDTMSGHAHAHVPQPFPVAVPDSRDMALAEAYEHLAGHHQAELERTEAERAAQEAQATGVPAPGSYAPLSDEEYGAHVARAQHTVATELGAGHATAASETLDGAGQVWSPERAAKHNEIANQIADQPEVPSEHHAILATGMPGPAKAAALKKALDDRHALVSVDQIKAELAKRGMVPGAEGLSPAERSALVHAEAGHVAHLATSRLAARGKNLALDIPGSSAEAIEAHRALLAHRGYRVHGLLAKSPADATAAAAAHRKGLEAYRQGKGDGTRLAPPDLVRSAERPGGGTVNEDAFNQVRDKLDSWQVQDGAKTVEKSPGPEQAGIMSVEDLVRRQQQ